VLDVENKPALVVAQLGKLRVEVELVQWRRDADGRRAFDLHQRHDHLVEHRQVHKRRLFDLGETSAHALSTNNSAHQDHVGADTAKRVRCDSTTG
jgi:hypothetical protein